MTHFTLLYYQKPNKYKMLKGFKTFYMFKSFIWEYRNVQLTLHSPHARKVRTLWFANVHNHQHLILTLFLSKTTRLSTKWNTHIRFFKTKSRGRSWCSRHYIKRLLLKKTLSFFPGGGRLRRLVLFQKAWSRSGNEVLCL